MKTLLSCALSLSLIAPASVATPDPVVARGADIVETAADAGSFGTLLAAAQAAGLDDALKAEGPLTVFAPTDAAFAALPAGTVESLLEPANKAQLVAILTYHVVPGAVGALDALQAGEATTLQGASLAFRLADGRLKVNESTVVSNDIAASNGVIHVIDQVLLPPAPQGRTVIGVYTGSVDRHDRQRLGLDAGEGLRIESLVKGGPSAAAGILPGDIVLAVDGETADSDVLAAAKQRAGVGGTIELLVARRITVKVALDEH